MAKQWLRDQGVSAREALAHSDTSGVDKSTERSLLLPRRHTTQPGTRRFPLHPQPEVTTQTVPSPRPYNLDRLINERNRAEADLEDMIKEMRGKLGGR